MQRTPGIVYSNLCLICLLNQGTQQRHMLESIQQQVFFSSVRATLQHSIAALQSTILVFFANSRSSTTFKQMVLVKAGSVFLIVVAERELSSWLGTSLTMCCFTVVLEDNRGPCRLS